MSELLLRTIVRRARNGINNDLISRIREWIGADWESHDIDSEAVELIRLLVDELSRRSILR